MKTNHFCSSGNSNKPLAISLCFVALLLGGIIYVLFRASEPVFFKWIPGLASDSWFNIVRHRSLSFSQFLPDWFVFSLPNGLWAFAYALLISGIWAESKSWLKTFWMASIPLLVLGFEILQYTRTIPGVFCLYDIALGTAGMIIGIFVGIQTINPYPYEKAL
jgi:hypothetical protein